MVISAEIRVGLTRSVQVVVVAQVVSIITQMVLNPVMVVTDITLVIPGDITELAAGVKAGQTVSGWDSNGYTWYCVW